MGLSSNRMADFDQTRILSLSCVIPIKVIKILYLNIWSYRFMRLLGCGQISPFWVPVDDKFPACSLVTMVTRRSPDMVLCAPLNDLICLHHWNQLLVSEGVEARCDELGTYSLSGNCCFAWNEEAVLSFTLFLIFCGLLKWMSSFQNCLSSWRFGGKYNSVSLTVREVLYFGLNTRPPEKKQHNLTTDINGSFLESCWSLSHPGHSHQNKRVSFDVNDHTRNRGTHFLETGNVLC